MEPQWSTSGAPAGAISARFIPRKDELLHTPITNGQQKSRRVERALEPISSAPAAAKNDDSRVQRPFPGSYRLSPMGPFVSVQGSMGTALPLSPKLCPSSAYSFSIGGQPHRCTDVYCASLLSPQTGARFTLALQAGVPQSLSLPASHFFIHLGNGTSVRAQYKDRK